MTCGKCVKESGYKKLVMFYQLFDGRLFKVFGCPRCGSFRMKECRE